MRSINLVKAAPFDGAGVMSESTRSTLAVMREASREATGDQWRDDMADCMEEFNEEDETDCLTDQDQVNENEYRAYRRHLTCELVDSLED